MTKYIIKNGETTIIKPFPSLEDAITWAENFCDQSQYINVQKQWNILNVNILTDNLKRELFMDIFRDENFHNFMTVEDCIEIFKQVLVGSSDITLELLENLLSEYCVENINVSKAE